jgi:hypothetical protein
VQFGIDHKMHLYIILVSDDQDSRRAGKTAFVAFVAVSLNLEQLLLTESNICSTFQFHCPVETS